MNGDMHVQEAQNAVMLEQDRLMDRIKAGDEATDRSDDEVYCAPPLPLSMSVFVSACALVSCAICI